MPITQFIAQATALVMGTTGACAQCQILPSTLGYCPFFPWVTRTNIM